LGNHPGVGHLTLENLRFQTFSETVHGVAMAFSRHSRFQAIPAEEPRVPIHLQKRTQDRALRRLTALGGGHGSAEELG